MGASIRQGLGAVAVSVTIAACGGAETPPKTKVHGAAEDAGETPKSQPPGTMALRLRNGAQIAIELDQSLGPVTPLSLIDEAGEHAPLGLFLPPHPCECPCDGPPPEQACSCDDARPEAEPVSLDAGEVHTVYWDGRVRRLHAGPSGRCYAAVEPTPGAYRLRACDRRGRACATATVQLPKTESEFKMTLQPNASAEPKCADRSSLARAVRLARAEAELSGVAPELLAGCDPDAASCGGRTPPRGLRCVVHVRPRDRAYLVTMLPVWAQGAPRRIEARIDGDAIGAQSVDVAASRWGVAHEGRFRVLGMPSQASHTHGGAAASVSEASFKVFNETGEPVALRVSEVRWSSRGQCQPPGMDGTPAALTKVQRMGAKPAEDPKVLTLDPGASTIRLSFEAQSAAQSYCQRFAAVAKFEAGKEQFEASAEIKVKRRAPRRP